MSSGGNNRINLIGEKFGGLLVVEEAGSTSKNLALWKCLCDCGNYYVTTGYYLRQGRKKSCGCKNSRNYGSKSPFWSGYEGISGSYWHRIIQGAKSRNFEVSITKEYIWDLFIKQNKKCALTGVDIELCDSDKRKRMDLKLQTASLDRINSLKGYIKGNVQWIHKDVNRIKMDLDQDYFIKLCKMVSDNVEKFNK